MENNVKSLISLQKLQSNQLSSKESLDKSVILCAGSGVAASEEKFLNVNNPFAAPAKQQQQQYQNIIQSSSQMEQISKQTLSALNKIQKDLESYITDIKVQNRKSIKENENKVKKVFKEKVVDNLIDLNMAQLYSLSTTPIGKQYGLGRKLLSKYELDLLEQMGKEETLRDMEESVMMSASSYGGGVKQPHFMMNKGLAQDPDRSEGLMDYNQIRQQVGPDGGNEVLQLRKDKMKVEQEFNKLKEKYENLKKQYKKQK